MNTCQKSIKNSILSMYLHPRHGRRYENTTVVPSVLKLRRESQAEKHWPPKYVSYDETTETVIAPYWSE